MAHKKPSRNAAKPAIKLASHAAHAATKTASHAAHAATKTASSAAGKATAAALSAAESARNSAESMVKFSTDTMKEIFSNSTEEAQKAQEKVFAVGRESAENISRAVEAFTRTVNDMAELGRDNAEAAVEVSHIAADIAKSINDEIVSSANSNFADNVEIAKEVFAARNANDLFDLQSKWLSANLDNFFTQSTRIAELCFQLASEAAEPINERVAETTERFSKSLAA